MNHQTVPLLFKGISVGEVYCYKVPQTTIFELIEWLLAPVEYFPHRYIINIFLGSICPSVSLDVTRLGHIFSAGAMFFS